MMRIWTQSPQMEREELLKALRMVFPHPTVNGEVETKDSGSNLLFAVATYDTPTRRRSFSTGELSMVAANWFASHECTHVPVHLLLVNKLRPQRDKVRTQRKKPIAGRGRRCRSRISLCTTATAASICRSRLQFAHFIDCEAICSTIFVSRPFHCEVLLEICVASQEVMSPYSSSRTYV